ncbi:MAG: hypothetical protein CVT66_04880 [Actinobacteria bacterium HGW-Actinobacteria-6]|jgi:hypothetical protein|nr:MAG: hypothetical protein CVT66_04880 [Actinobacteria bacterium HGW-Actinobacteria-6]
MYASPGRIATGTAAFLPFTMRDAFLPFTGSEAYSFVVAILAAVVIGLALRTVANLGSRAALEPVRGTGADYEIAFTRNGRPVFFVSRLLKPFRRDK